MLRLTGSTSQCCLFVSDLLTSRSDVASLTPCISINPHQAGFMSHE
ncbi:hypothetical protein EC919_111114 [Pseudomonas graminis]|nr:hypothetical protein EC919_111114 [Pseudomonas graminis]